MLNLTCALKKAELPEIERYGRSFDSEQRIQAWHADILHGFKVATQDLILPLVLAANGT